MKLDKNILNDLDWLKDNNVITPTYDLSETKENTLDNPIWLHFGAGNIFRGFVGQTMQKLLNNEKSRVGIIAAEGFDYEIVDKLKDYDNLTINVTLKKDGTIDNEIIGSIIEYYKMDHKHEDFGLLKEIAVKPSLQLLTFTITEKGYNLLHRDGSYLPDVLDDFENGPENPKSYLGKVVSLLINRFTNGKHPIALVSMDNMSQNGSVLESAVITFAKEWLSRELITENCYEYLSDRKLVTFPWTMIDKITPRPDVKVEKMLNSIGFENLDIQQTSKNSFVSPFVNSEEIGYLAIEDDFPNGRPPLEEAGIIFGNREIVHQIETMKVTTLLNPLHTALAIFGNLLEYDYIYQTVEDKILLNLINELGYTEGLKVVVDPGIIKPKSFLDEVIEIRLPNRFIPDTPQRIATDTSQKVKVRFSETIKAYQNDEKLNVTDLKAIPIIIAGWMRYLIGVTDKGNILELSPDPLLNELVEVFGDFELGKSTITPEIKEFLKNKTIFGLDLYEVGLADKILNYFEEMTQGVNCVSETLKKYFS